MRYSKLARTRTRTHPTLTPTVASLLHSYPETATFLYLLDAMLLGQTVVVSIVVAISMGVLSETHVVVVGHGGNSSNGAGVRERS